MLIEGGIREGVPGEETAAAEAVSASAGGDEASVELR